MIGRIFLPVIYFLQNGLPLGRFFCIITMHSYAYLSISLFGKESLDMELWQKYLLAAGMVLLLLILAIRGAVRKAQDQKKRAFARKLETVLQPRENIKLICPQKNGQVILTSRRLLFETERGFQAVPMKNIKRVHGRKADGKKTTSVNQMTDLVLKAEKEYTIHNQSPEFPQLAKQVISKVNSQNRRKKAEKEKKNGKT